MELTKRIAFFLFISLFGFLTCTSTILEPEVEREGGFVLTFDDRHIKEWNRIRPLLKKYNVRATFFISAYHTLRNSDKLILDSLKLEGHEIACHSVNHLNAVDFLQTHTIDEYLNTDIFPAINLMKQDGHYPTTFSYPYGMNNAQTDSALLNYFKLLRDVADVQRFTSKVSEIDTIESIYFKYDGANIIAGLGIDENFNISINEIEKGFKRAVKNKEIIVLYAHKPVKTVSRSYQISYEYLEKILILAQNLELKSFRFDELALK